MHDQELARTTLVTGLVTDMTSSALQQVHLRSVSMPAMVPLLREVASDVTLVEIKQKNGRDLVGRVIQVMEGRKWRLQSFDRANLVHARELAPSVPVALLMSDLAGVTAAIAGGWPAYMDHHLLDEAVVGRLRDSGLTVGAWTVNSEEALRRIAPFRPDVIISDVPRLIRDWLADDLPARRW